jgi:hypothetical protein
VLKSKRRRGRGDYRSGGDEIVEREQRVSDKYVPSFKSTRPVVTVEIEKGNTPIREYWKRAVSKNLDGMDDRQRQQCGAFEGASLTRRSSVSVWEIEGNFNGCCRSQGNRTSELTTFNYEKKCLLIHGR